MDPNENSQPVEKKGKRRRNPESHKKTLLKRAGQAGAEHINEKGVVVAARSVQIKDCSKCPRKCSKKKRAEQREAFNRDYWELSSTQLKNQFIANWVEQSSTKQSTTASNSRRDMSRFYFLPDKGCRVPVCKGFFMATLAIKDNKIRLVLNNLPESKCAVGDRRGQHPGRRLPEIDRDVVRDHIRLFQIVPSHYCRKDSNYDYLPGELDVTKIYNMYVDYCKENNFHKVLCAIYRKTFNEEFHLKFHKPRKDQCDTCFAFDHMTVEEKKSLMESQDLHLKRRQDAATLHDESKIKCLAGEINFIQMDMAAVRLCPSVEARAIFYKRRLSVFNFTVYDVFSSKALCLCGTRVQRAEDLRKLGHVC